MKNKISQMLFLLTLSFSQLAAQCNSCVTAKKLIGTWKAQKIATGEIFYFTLSANHKAHSYGDGWDTYTYWHLDGDECCFHDENDKKLYYSVITYLTKDYMEYYIARQGDYTAYRVENDFEEWSNAENKSTKSTTNPPKVVQTPKTKSTTSKENSTSHFYLCGGCLNTGETTCSSCNGRGGGVSIGYCSLLSCGNGKRRCEYCHQRGCTSIELAFAINAKLTMPNPSLLIGKWKCSNGDTYEFFNDKVDTGTQTLVIFSAGKQFFASWIVEDGFLKIRMISAFDDHFEKYWFKGAWSNNRIMVQSMEDYKILTLTK
ncbi:MAG: hypothetical protein RLZZ628_3030 [Bacteroidota bacterium]|jgi:hypothetical protein